MAPVLPSCLLLRFLGALVLVACAAQGSRAQPLNPQKRLTQYILDNWQQEDGLPQNSVVSIQQTPDGYLWFATFQGLARFDGVHMRNFTASNTPALVVNAMRVMILGRDSTLWVGSVGGGVTGYKNGVFAHYGDSSATVWSLMEDANGRIWVGTNTGVSVYVNGEMRDVSAALGVQDQVVLSIAQDTSGAVWLGTKDELLRLAPGWNPEEGNRVVLQAFPEVGRNVEALLLSGQGYLWVGSEDGVFRQTSLGFRSLRDADGPGISQIKEFYEDRRGSLWIATLDKGLYRLRNGNFDNLSREKGLPDAQVESVFEDQEGSLWFGSYRSGFFRLKEGKFTNLGKPEGINGVAVYAVLELSEERAYIGTTTGGITELYRGQVQGIYTERAGLVGNYVRTIYPHPDGSLWVGTYGKGISVLRGGRVVRSYTTRDGLADNSVRGIYGARNGGMWLATKNGLSHFQNGRFQTFGRAAGIEVPSIITLLYDTYGTLWVGTEGGGLYRMASDSFGVFEPVAALSGDVVLSLYFDVAERCIWVGTSTGLARVNPDGVVAKITSEDAAPGTFPGGVTQLIEDDLGHLWMGSNDGVYFIQKQGLLRYIRGETDTLAGERFGVKDGMRSASCLPGGSPSVLKRRDGTLWFSTAEGVAIIDPARIPRNEVPPPVVIESVRRGETYIENRGMCRLSPSRDPLEIHYTGLSYISPMSVQMKYRLLGFDDNWVPVGNRRVAYFTNLPPGRYTFEVLAANNDGVWSSAPARMVLVITTPWFQQWWAWGLYILLLGGLVVGGVRLRYRQLEVEKLRLERLVDERTSEILDQKAELQSAYEEIQQQVQQVERANRELELAYTDIERQNKSVTDSMEYARRIQEAILPSMAVVQTALPKSFVFYEPRDIVSGDFYWFVRKSEAFYIAVVDCTGHGVPGAFMSVMGNALLNQLVNERKLRQPADILYHLNTAVQNNLHQYDPTSTSLDGMEISLAAINPLAMHLSFAAANQVLYRYRGNAMEEYKGDRYPIGGGQYGIRTFTQHEIDIELGDTFYLFSDGVADQFGGPRSRKFGYNRLKSLFSQIQILSMREQQAQIAHTVAAWRGDMKQVDDILIIGFRF